MNVNKNVSISSLLCQHLTTFFRISLVIIKLFFLKLHIFGIADLFRVLLMHIRWCILLFTLFSYSSTIDWREYVVMLKNYNGTFTFETFKRSDILNNNGWSISHLFTGEHSSDFNIYKFESILIRWMWFWFNFKTINGFLNLLHRSHTFWLMLNIVRTILALKCCILKCEDLSVC